MNNYNNISFSKAINLGIFQSMRKDNSVVCFGLGVTDPKGVFGTTNNLEEAFGSERVFDMPTSENAMTGVAIGLSMSGFKPLMTHQRLDFFLLAMDQLVNSASKWHYMFGSQISIPITIRLIIGRGWGQGPTHSQNLQSWFAHIPGLKVVMPSSPEDAKGLLLASIFDPNPVIFLEHRWLHNSIGKVTIEPKIIDLGKANLIQKGNHITIVSMSYMTVEAIHATNFLQKYNIYCDLVDLRSIKPIDWDLIFKSVSKTKKLLVLDTGHKTCSVSGEIIATVTENLFSKLEKAPIRLTIPDVPEPTSFGLTRNYHMRANDIAKICSKLMNKNLDKEIEKEFPIPNFHDIPGDWFKGPF